MQRAILEVKWGPSRFRKAAIEPGATLRVGRQEKADFVIAGDPDLSGLHFELRWDGATCVVRDLASANGTRVSGSKIDEQPIGNGAWIRAGGTDFSVYIEGSTPPPRERSFDDPDDDDDYPPDERAERVAWREARRREEEGLAARKRAALSELNAAAGQGGRLFAVLDAARSDRIVVALQESVEAYDSLFAGPDGALYDAAAPYLVELPHGSRLLEQIVMEGWEGRWGIFIVSDRPLRDVRSHLRRFLRVTDQESGKHMYFRFYDPAILRRFIPSATVHQLNIVFGDAVTAFLAESEPGRLLRFERGGAAC